jgi:hypothetical protein
MHLSARDRARIAASFENVDAQPHAVHPNDGQPHSNGAQRPATPVTHQEGDGPYNNQESQNQAHADPEHAYQQPHFAAQPEAQQYANRPQQQDAHVADAPVVHQAEQGSRSETYANNPNEPETRANTYAMAFDGVERGLAPAHAEDAQAAVADAGNPPSAAARVAEQQPRPNPHEWTEAARAAVNRLVTEDPQVRALHERGAQLPANDRTFFDRNLAEVEAYTKTPQGAQNREELLHALDVSVRGRSVRLDGLDVFPLLPQFVGEDIPGFDNWFLRKSTHREKDVPGAEYGPGLEPLNRHIDYLSAADREEARVFVHDGRLVGSQSLPLTEGKYIFVVDQEGRLIAQQPVVGRIHHSSLSAGEPVLTAGEFEIDGQGKLTRITNQSGHFRPNTASFEHFVAALEEQGVNLDGVQALALKLTTATNGNFDVDHDFTNLLDAQHHRNLQLGPANILAPLAHPNPADPAHPVDPAADPRPADPAHEESYGNRPSSWVLPRQIRGWSQRRSVVSAEPDLDLAA